MEGKIMLHVEGLTRSVHSGHLFDIFSTYGEVTRTMVEKDALTGLSKGFGTTEKKRYLDLASSQITIQVMLNF